MLKLALVLVTGFLICSRIAIANQPTLGPAGILEAVRNLDLVALTPSIIHLDHIGVGFLIGVALFGREYRSMAFMLAVFVTVFEVALFLSRGGS